VINEDIGARLGAIEERLAALERRVGETAPAPQPPQGPGPPTPQATLSRPTAPPRVPEPPPRRPPTPSSALTRLQRADEREEADSGTITNLLGWSGAVALVLAAAYLIRLAIDAGWLTPSVQVGCAALFGVALIVAGFAMSGVNRRYAGLLPAAGIVVLFLSVYGAHLLYYLIDAREAWGGVMVVCAVSLGLCFAFDTDLYALFAVAGSYSAPFLLPHIGASVSELAIYYSGWSVTFTVLSIVRGTRLIYLLALYVALVGFDALTHPAGPDWQAALGFQAAQFLIFGIGAVVFSIRHGEPMDEGVAIMHLPALVLFYALEYLVLKTHLPEAAPWIAVGTLLAMALLYVMARVGLGRSSPGGQLLLGSYAALVLFHAGYLEAVPTYSAPWVALVLVIATVAARRFWSAAGNGLVPLLIAVGVIFAINLLRVLTGASLQAVPGYKLLPPLYAGMLYLGYVLTRIERRQTPFSPSLLYAGHLTAMSATVQLIHEPILQSVSWGLLALLCMGWSLGQHDRLVGQSSLLLFGATAVKVMLFDLHGAAPLARIVSLFVLGVTFYVGGLLYRRVAPASAPLVSPGA